MALTIRNRHARVVRTIKLENVMAEIRLDVAGNTEMRIANA